MLNMVSMNNIMRAFIYSYEMDVDCKTIQEKLLQTILTVEARKDRKFLNADVNVLKEAVENTMFFCFLQQKNRFQRLHYSSRIILETVSTSLNTVKNSSLLAIKEQSWLLWSASLFCCCFIMVHEKVNRYSLLLLVLCYSLRQFLWMLLSMSTMRL